MPERSDERNFLAESSYLDLKYNETRSPRTAYPQQFARWLVENVYQGTGRLLDLGSGRGDHLAAFAALGFAVEGVDIAPRSVELAAGFRVHRVDFDAEPLPFPPESFDYVFSKSVLEHVRNAASFLAGAREVLLPGGRAAILTPAWEYTYRRIFYSEYTHVRPFTRQSLHEALTLAGFEDVSVRYFRQLPFLWRRPALTPLAEVVRLMPLPYRPLDEARWPPMLNTLIRFSKEVLLLGTGVRGHHASQEKTPSGSVSSERGL
jgi:SAM-dependent methyltransferase